jgi:hypothetical protein
VSEPIHILSLGAGVQSSTLALMAARGEVGPMPTAAIFADTQAEPKGVYRWLDWLEKQMPFPLYRVTAGSLTERITTTRINQKTGNEYYSNMIPAFVRNKDGSRGIVGRSCTSDFKMIPLIKKQREIAKIKRGQKEIGVISWIGISLDEVVRMRNSKDAWALNRYPLIENRMTRHDCLLWMERNGYPRPPRSACAYCPFHSDAEWRRLRDEEPESFQAAVEVERKLQSVHRRIKTKGRMNGVAFLHSSLVPLDQVDFSTAEDHGQLDLFKNECAGMCGV